jgi:transposase-like protein
VWIVGVGISASQSPQSLASHSKFFRLVRETLQYYRMHEKTLRHRTKPVEACPYCRGNEITRKGLRKNKYGDVQLFYCRRCKKKFTPLVTKNKTFPLRIILDSMTLYNRLYSLEDAAARVTEKYGLPVSRQNISNWLEGFAPYLSIARLRPALARRHDKYSLITDNINGLACRFKSPRNHIHIFTKRKISQTVGNFRVASRRRYLITFDRRARHQLSRRPDGSRDLENSAGHRTEAAVVAGKSSKARRATVLVDITPATSVSATKKRRS